MEEIRIRVFQTELKEIVVRVKVQHCFLSAPVELGHRHN